MIVGTGESVAGNVQFVVVKIYFYRIKKYEDEMFTPVDFLNKLYFPLLPLQM